MWSKTCSACGMIGVAAPRYHPHLACLAFRATRNGATVEVNLRAAVEYGMRAQRAGVTLDDAMENIVTVIDPKGRDSDD